MRLTYEGTLRFPYGFHSGDGRRTGAVDQPLFREADGRVALSGASLAGVLRADLERLLSESAGPEPGCSREPGCDCVVCRLFGPRAPKTRGRSAESPGLRASKLHVLGGSIPGEGATRVRDRVGIDRRTRTAAEGRKYDVEVVNGGCELPFELRLDEAEEDERAYLEAALRRLAAGWLFLGGKSASGLGRAEVTSLRRLELDLGERESLIRHLLAEESSAGCSITPLVSPEDASWAASWDLPAEGESPGRSGQLRIGFELDFPLGFLVNDPVEALLSGFDHTFTRSPDGSPLLPGSALRGALRSRAEQILRTIGESLGGDASSAACDLNRKGAACHERVEAENRRRAEGGEEALRFEEEKARHCAACQVFGSGRLASSIKLTDFPLRGSGPGAPLPQELLALDRFTGGGKDGAKFNLETRAGVTLAGEIHLEIGPHRLAKWGLGLVALVLRDLLLADLPLGFGTAKGLNEYRARITGIDRFWLRPPEPFAAIGLAGGAGTARWRPAEGQALDGPGAALAALPPGLRQGLEGWVAALHQELAPAPAEAAPEGKEEGRDA